MSDERLRELFPMAFQQDEPATEDPNLPKPMIEDPIGRDPTKTPATSQDYDTPPVEKPPDKPPPGWKGEEEQKPWEKKTSRWGSFMNRIKRASEDAAFEMAWGIAKDAGSYEKPEECDCIACDPKSDSTSDWCWRAATPVNEDGTRDYSVMRGNSDA